MNASTRNDAASRGKKRPKVKGCYQCSRRRIDCDGGRPECQKCKAKGLTCDRLGIRYRFCDSVASRGKLAGKQVANLLSYNSPLIPCHMSEQSSSRPSTSVLTLASDRPPSKLPADANVDALQCQLDLTESIESSHLTLSDDQHDIASFGCWVDRVLDHINGETRSYLQYFSDVVAPVTAVIDAGFNGYRDLILPAAETDELVRKTVVFVARQHFALQLDISPDNSGNYDSIIGDLIQRSTSSPPHQDKSALTALLLLQISAFISGTDDFQYVFGPLRALVRVCLFGESLLSESDGVAFLLARSEDCLEFMRFCLELHPELDDLMSDLFSMIGIARDIYIRRALNNAPSFETAPLLEQFRLLSEKVDAHVDLVGRHLLAWSYFVVAAESTTAEHRTFFLQKLKQLYENTKCGNIRKAIHQVETLWAVQPVVRWTSALGGPTQALIM